MKHWFHKLSESGQATVAIEDWERKAREMDKLEKRRKELKKELKKLDETIYQDLRKDWTLEEIYFACSSSCWKSPDWWEPF